MLTHTWLTILVNFSYVRMDGWDEEAEKWFERKAEEASA